MSNDNILSTLNTVLENCKHLSERAKDADSYEAENYADAALSLAKAASTLYNSIIQASKSFAQTERPPESEKGG